jgi:hypothetical protein
LMCVIKHQTIKNIIENIISVISRCNELYIDLSNHGMSRLKYFYLHNLLSN